MPHESKGMDNSNSKFEDVIEDLLKDAVQCGITAAGFSDTDCHQIVGHLKVNIKGSVVDAAPYILGINRANAPQKVLDALKALNTALEEWDLERSKKQESMQCSK